MTAPARKRTGGGMYDPDARNVYFLASSPSVVHEIHTVADHVLIAVNEIDTPEHERLLEAMVTSGVRVLLDSGVYNLSTQHAKRHGLTMDAALRLPVEQVDGFDELLAKYLRLVRKWADRLWGYIEIDLGGVEGKRRTRGMLEAEGLAPIPVYHPLNDGWQYFDELASTYDRMCVGNVVQASRYVRLRLVATIAERQRAYPGLWIHLLGLTPSEWLMAYPVASGDSSSWLSAVRWSGYIERTGLKAMGHLPKNYQYKLGDKVTWLKGWRMGAYGGALHAKTWQTHVRRLRAEGVDP